MKQATFLIVADRGSLAAYEVDRTVKKPVARLVENMEFAESHQRLGEQVTDRAGAFPMRGNAGGATAASERLTLAAELDARSIRRVAGHIATFLKKYRPVSWAFAAPAEINGAILDGVHPAFRERLALNVRRDFIHVPAADVLDHFLKAAP